jgi:hypothetical protein
MEITNIDRQLKILKKNQFVQKYKTNKFFINLFFVNLVENNCTKPGFNLKPPIKVMLLKLHHVQTYLDQHPDCKLIPNTYGLSKGKAPGAPMSAGQPNALLQKPNSEMRPLHLRFFTLESSVKNIALNTQLVVVAECVHSFFFVQRDAHLCPCCEPARGPFVYE